MPSTASPSSVRLYHQLPHSLQNLVCSYRGLRLNLRRYGGLFNDNFQASLDSYFQPISTIRANQKHQLTRIFEAASHSPYWRAQFQTYDLDISQDPFVQLLKLPVISKREVQANLADIPPSQKYLSRYSLSPVHTSGSTGAGLNFSQTRLAEQAQWCIWWRYRHQIGLDRTTWSGIFTGQPIVSPLTKSPPYWRTNIPSRQTLFSQYHLNHTTVTYYIDKLRRSNLRWLHGYPSFIYMLASLASELSIPAPTCISIITTGSENLQPHQKRLIESYFRAPVFDHYGLSEAVCNISMTPSGSYRIDEDFSFVELLPLADNQYRVVGTNLSNPAFPLFRYDTLDIVSLPVDKQHDYLGWRYVSSVDGRQEDYLYLTDGTPVGRVDHLFKDANGLIEAQLIQYELGKATLLYRCALSYDKVFVDLIKHEVSMRFGGKLTVNFQRTDQPIKRTASGKHRLVISYIRS